MPSHALYLYCVMPVTGPRAPALSTPALDGGPVHAVRHGDLAAIAHGCPPEPYQGAEAEVRAWVLAHNAVVEEAWRHAGSVLPMSFDVIVRGGAGRSAEANLAGWLEAHHAALRGRLAALDGRAEFGVQVLWEPGGPDGPGAAGGQPAARPRGRDYFAHQQLRRRLSAQAREQAEAGCRRYLEGLAALADDVRVNKVRPADGRQMALNVSLLVARGAVGPVGEYLERVSQEPGVEVRFTGPWPPYSFAGEAGAIAATLAPLGAQREEDRR